MGHGMLEEMWKNVALLKIEYCSTYLALCVLADILNAENNYTNWCTKDLIHYRKISNISCTKSLNLIVSGLG